MPPSITNVIPAVPASMQGVANAEFPGVRLPDLTAVGCQFTRAHNAGCSSCSRNTDHKQWRRIELGPATASRGSLGFFSDIATTIKDVARKAQALIRMMHLTAHGMIETDSVYSAGGYPVATVYGGWTVTSASGNTVTCTYTAGSANPSDITWSMLSENPDWGQPDGSGGIQGRWINSVFHGSIPGGRGIFKLSGNSQLSRHAGWIVRKITASKSIAVGNSFNIILETPIGGLATTLRPGTSAPITGGITLYSTADEPWAQPRDSYPMWSFGQVEISIAPASVDGQIAPYAIKPNQAGGNFNPVAYKHTGGAWVVDPDLLAKIYLDHPSGGATVTKADLSEYDMTGVAALKIVAWKEDPGADAGAVIVGQDRCARSVYDPTGSNGVDDGAGRFHYCGAADALRALGAGAFPDTHYKAKCTLTKCPSWTHDTPSHPFDPALWHGIVWGIPWKVVQRFVDGGGDNTVFDLFRNDSPGLAGLVKGIRNCPTGYHATIDWTLHSGGWPQIRTKTVAGQPVVFPLYGLEWLERNNADEDADYWDTAKWPEFGPAGNMWPKKVEHKDEVTSDTNDPKKMQRQRIFGGGRDVHRYKGTAIGGIGRRHRFSPEKYELYFPRLPASHIGEVQAYDDGTFQRGLWDQHFQLCSISGLPVVYGAKITIKRLRYDRTRSEGHGGDVGAVTVKSVVADGAGIYKITLRNGVEMASSLIGGVPRQETATQWRAGGTNVQTPEFGRLSNYISNNATVGVNRSARVEAGHALVFSNDAIPANSRLKDRRFLITKATAASSSTREDWRLTTSQAGKAFYDAGYFFQPYGSTEEQVLSVTVTRNGGATTLKAAPGEYKLYGLAKDVYQWFEGANDAGQKGVQILFSSDNGTGADADRVMAITVVTTAGTYGPTSFNIEADAIGGWGSPGSKQTFSYTSPSGENIGSIEHVRGRRQNGEVTTLSAATGGFANWASLGIDKYTVVGLGTATIAVTVSPDWANDNIEIMCNLGSGDGLTNTQYRDQRVMIHQGIPEGYSANGDRCDEIWITDEAGAVADHLTRFGATALNDLLLGVSSISFMQPGTEELIDATPDDGGSDTPIDEANYAAFCANGEFYIKTAQAPAEGHCAIVKGKVGIDQDILFASEIDAVRRALEIILWGDA